MTTASPTALKGPYRSWIAVEGDNDEPAFRISAAHDEWNHLAIPLVAMERGFFAREGLRHAELVATGDESDQVLGMAAGWIDLAVDPLTSMVLAANAELKKESIQFRGQCNPHY